MSLWAKTIFASSAKIIRSRRSIWKVIYRKKKIVKGPVLTIALDISKRCICIIVCYKLLAFV